MVLRCFWKPAGLSPLHNSLLAGHNKPVAIAGNPQAQSATRAHDTASNSAYSSPVHKTDTSAVTYGWPSMTLHFRASKNTVVKLG